MAEARNFPYVLTVNDRGMLHRFGIDPGAGLIAGRRVPLTWPRLASYAGHRPPVLRKKSIRSQILPLKPRAGNQCTIPEHGAIP